MGGPGVGFDQILKEWIFELEFRDIITIYIYRVLYNAYIPYSMSNPPIYIVCIWCFPTSRSFSWHFVNSGGRRDDECFVPVLLVLVG